jgi:hypothetical protein
LLAEGDLHRVTDYIQEQLQAELGLAMNVHPVSSLPDYSVMLDHFFERELLPRFDQARELRNRSIARKIGALRDAVSAAFETALDQHKRRDRGLPADVHGLEERLRLVTGEIGEQRTVLSHAFLRLGETPDVMLSETADKAFNWMRANSKTHVTSSQLSEWLHDAVWKALERQIESVRNVSQRAIDTLQEVAREMGRTDMPAQDEVESLLRNMPRFELSSLPEAINMRFWIFLGSGVVRARIKNSLRQSVGVPVKQALHLYGHALSQWSHQFVNGMVVLVSSYAEAYRVQLHRIAGTSTDNIDAPQLEQDLDILKSWGGNRGSKALL